MMLLGISNLSFSLWVTICAYSPCPQLYLVVSLRPHQMQPGKRTPTASSTRFQSISSQTTWHQFLRWRSQTQFPRVIEASTTMPVPCTSCHTAWWKSSNIIRSKGLHATKCTGRILIRSVCHDSPVRSWQKYKRERSRLRPTKCLILCTNRRHHMTETTFSEDSVGGLYYFG